MSLTKLPSDYTVAHNIIQLLFNLVAQCGMLLNVCNTHSVSSNRNVSKLVYISKLYTIESLSTIQLKIILTLIPIGYHADSTLSNP